MLRGSSHFRRDREDRSARETIRVALQLMEAEKRSAGDGHHRQALRQAAAEVGIAPEFIDRAFGQLEERGKARRRRVALLAVAGFGLVGASLFAGGVREEPAPVAMPVVAPAPAMPFAPPPLFHAPFRSHDEWKILLIDQQKAR